MFATEAVIQLCYKQYYLKWQIGNLIYTIITIDLKEIRIPNQLRKHATQKVRSDMA